jgi:hypothetical protein
VTNDSRHTESVWCTGARNATESVEAVTTDARLWRVAEIDAVMSISLINFPPKRVL